MNERAENLSLAWAAGVFIILIGIYVLTMPQSITLEQMAELDAAFGFTVTKNNVIVRDWLELAIVRRYEPAMDRLESYLVSIGRGWLIRRLYQALVDTDWGRPMATRVFAEARAGYHPLTQAQVDAILAE